jgi:hypothetical protein
VPAFLRLTDLDARIATIRENIRELVEQAAGASGAFQESLIADRIAGYEAQLATAMKERETLQQAAQDSKKRAGLDRKP